ncbi:MDR/zinc-dependent alcohol dehydrogenase-like family protein [Sphingobium chungbukense]|uniref:NADH oxidase n=1 Tax=Sphingobium chungbukense TaxID=56193 RepID=A0A0M3AYD7_9SPHN|nr:NADH oxidase [Sphingobium chungbukense]KKW93931.1 NADH oxidase [Sphingobium chungbukense]
MTNEIPAEGLQLRTLISSDGQLRVRLARVPVEAPGPDEVLIRVEATPINPSDQGGLVGAADHSTLKVEDGVLTGRVPPMMLQLFKNRLDEEFLSGNEGAGVVIAAGDNARALLGRTVALLGGSMYAQYRLAKASEVLLLPEGTTPAQGASAFINPLTVLGMVETMKREGHKALVHTAAASNVGQMLQRLCLAEGIPLVNIVRNQKQAQILRDIGATHVLDSTDAAFTADLHAALAETGATLAFDAVAGGPLAYQILLGMEAALRQKDAGSGVYGSAVHKQVYVYGILNPGPIDIMAHGAGMAWGVGGWLLFNFLARIGPDATQALRERVARDIRTIFASHYTEEISLADALKPEILLRSIAHNTGSKFLIAPQKGL